MPRYHPPLLDAEQASPLLEGPESDRKLTKASPIQFRSAPYEFGILPYQGLDVLFLDHSTM